MVHGWMRRVSKKHVSKKRKKRRDPSDFVWHMLTLLRQSAGRFMLGKYLSDKKIPWK